MSYEYEFDYTDEITEKTYSVSAFILSSYDSNYGADADGHRGVGMDTSELEDFEVTLNGVPEKDEGILDRAYREFVLAHERKAFEEAAENRISHREHDDFD